MLGGEWGLAISALFKFWTTVADPDKHKTAWDLANEKRTAKCMDAAESIIFAMDSFFNNNISKKQLQFIFKKHRQIYFKNN